MYINDIHILFYLSIGVIGLIVGQLIDWCNNRLAKYEKVLSKDEIIIKRIKVESDHIRVKGKILESLNKNRLITGIMKIEGIKEIVEE